MHERQQMTGVLFVHWGPENNHSCINQMISLTMFSCDTVSAPSSRITTLHALVRCESVVTVRSVRRDWVPSHDSGQRCESCRDRVSSVSPAQASSSRMDGRRAHSTCILSCPSTAQDGRRITCILVAAHCRLSPRHYERELVFSPGSQLCSMQLSKRKSRYWTVTLFTMRKCFLSVTMVFIVSEVTISLMLHVSSHVQGSVPCNSDTWHLRLNCRDIHWSQHVSLVHWNEIIIWLSEKLIVSQVS